MSNGKYDAADLAHLNKRDRQMSKSEYKRLNLTIPDMVKVIREQVLDEAINAVWHRYHDSKILTDESCSQAIDAIEALKNK